MYQKLSVALALACLGYVSLHANPYTGESKALEARLTRTVVSNLEHTKTTYDQYRSQLSSIKKPSYEVLRPLFVGLTAYNAEFENAKTQGERSQLANNLSKETWAGWNNYRPIGMIEIFDSYFPQENKDKEIALLEYNIKSNLLSKEQRQLMNVFKNMNFEYAAELDAPYDQFASTLRTSTSYKPKAIIEAMVPMIDAYNQLEKKYAGTEYLVKRSAFKMPIAAGWGRTTTVEDLRYYIGMNEMAGGDYVCAYTPEELQERYGVSKVVAEKFFAFVNDYNNTDK